MKSAAVFAVVLLLCFGASIYAGYRLISPEHRDLSQFSLTENGSGDLAQYKKIRLAFGAFDLVSGLTVRDLETLPGNRASSFYLLLACLWVVWALRRTAKE
jgi:hypothetical protein